VKQCLSKAFAEFSVSVSVGKFSGSQRGCYSPSEMMLLILFLSR